MSKCIKIRIVILKEKKINALKKSKMKQDLLKKCNIYAENVKNYTNLNETCKFNEYLI